MLDLKFVRENPEIVKQNIRNKFQDRKLPLVDEVIELDEQARATQTEADELRANRNKLSKQIGALMAQGKKEEAEEVKAKVNADAERLKELEAKESELNARVKEIMMTIPNITPIFSRNWLIKMQQVFVLAMVDVNLRSAWLINRACNPTTLSPMSPSISFLGVSAATESTTSMSTADERIS